MEKMKTSSSMYARKSRIDLKKIPPLDPSSIPSNSPMWVPFMEANYRRPATRMVPVYIAKQRAGDGLAQKHDKNLSSSRGEVEDEGGSFMSTKHIDPNSTKSSISSNEEQEHELEKDFGCQTKPGIEMDSGCQTKHRFEDDLKRVSAKSQLHEVCVAKHWKPPVYECCSDEGPCHMRLFTYKVVIEMVESSSTIILECFGAPQSKKKMAAEHAAEGALWYLRDLGHLKENKPRRHCQQKMWPISPT